VKRRTQLETAHRPMKPKRIWVCLQWPHGTNCRCPRQTAQWIRRIPLNARHESMSCDFSDPESVVLCFIASMHDWELMAHALRRSVRDSADPSSYQSCVLAAMDAVFKQFCTPKRRTNGRNGSFQNPPEYDPNHESVRESEIDGRLASVYTYRDSVIGGGRYRYCLKRHGGNWLIDTLKQCNEDGTESSAIL